MSNRETALRLAASGLAVFPCAADKRPVKGCFWRKESTTDRARIEAWWEAMPDALPAVDLGKSDHLVIDLDRHGGPDGVAAWAALPATDAPANDTPSGGRHIWFRQPRPMLGNHRGRLPPGIDVRGAGGYVIGPGAELPDGRRYGDNDIPDAPPIPGWLADMLTSKETAERPAAPPSSPQVDDRRVRAYAQAGLDAELSRLRSAIKGERNNVLNAVAFSLGQMEGAGWLSDAAGMLEVAAHDCGLVADDGIRAVRATIRSGLAAGRKKPRSDPPDQANGHVVDGAAVARRLVQQGDDLIDEETGEIVELPPTPFQWTDPTQIPRRQWIYGHHLIRRYLSCTVAPGAMGKSSMIIAEAMAMASGRNLLGDRVHERSRVWLWNGEDPRDELDRRAMATCMHYGISREELDGWLFIDTGRTTQIVLAHETRRDFQINEPMIISLEQMIRSRRIDVVIIDPFVKAHRISENDNIKIDQICQALTLLAERTGCAFELVHHVRKQAGGIAGDLTVDDARGAGSLIGAVRSARILNRMTEEEARQTGVDDRLRYFRIDNGKANLTPPALHATWRKLVSVPLGNGSGSLLDDQDHVGVVAPWEREVPADEITEEDIRNVQERINGGVWREDARSPQWVGNAIAEVLDLDPNLPDVRAMIKEAIRRWLKAGWLASRQGMDGKRRPKMFIEVGKWLET